MSTRDQYQPQMIVAARQVLLELAAALEDAQDKIVFVGGTACALLFPQEVDPHEGTIDVDVALDPDALAAYGMDTLEEKLLYANFQQDGLKKGEKPRPLKGFRWFRVAQVDGEAQGVEVAVDLLTAEYDDSRRYTESREIQGLHPSVLRGLDLAFLNPRWVPISGLLPGGRLYKTKIRVCSPASLLAMKGIAITDRKKGQDKDAFDIDYILRRCDGGIDVLARVLQNDLYWTNGLVQEGLQGIAQTFATPKSIGPTSIATEERYPDPEERAIVGQGVYQRVRQLLQRLKISARETSQ